MPYNMDCGQSVRTKSKVMRVSTGTRVDSNDDVDVVGLHHISMPVDGADPQPVRSTVQQPAHVVPVVFALDRRLLPLRPPAVVVCNVTPTKSK